MGFRYRKTINLGGGFRINLSKSGVGYSWGVKGYRVTKTAKGNVRETISIPRTGLSYVKESTKKMEPTPVSKSPRTDSKHYNTQEIVNNAANQMISDGLEEILQTAKRTIQADRISNIGMVISFIAISKYPLFLLLFVLFVCLKIYARTAGLVRLDYEIDPDQAQIVTERTGSVMRIAESNKLWRIMQSSQVIDTKYSGGASQTIKRVSCKALQEAPFPFKANIPIASFKSGKETLAFLPDKLIIMQGGNIGALNYSDISTSAGTTRFIEDGAVPSDARIVGQTWKYVNKSGGPDKRFKNNRKLPICIYGELELKSSYGLNTVIMFSKAQVEQPNTEVENETGKKSPIVRSPWYIIIAGFFFAGGLSAIPESTIVAILGCSIGLVMGLFTFWNIKDEKGTDTDE